MKIDFHVHSYFSEDSFQRFDKIIDKAEKMGLDGIVILDHNTIEGASLLETYLEERYRDQSLNDRLVVIRAGEYSTEEGHIIIIGLKTPLEHILEVDQKWYKCKEVVTEAKKQGAMIILAHPYRWKKRLPSEWLLSQIDAVEVFNGRTCFVKGNYDANAKAVALAKKLNLPIVGGSDGHLTNEIGKTYVIFDVEKDAFDPQKIYLYDSVVHGEWGHPILEVISQIYKFSTQNKIKPIPKQIVKAIYGILIYAYASINPKAFLKGDVMHYTGKANRLTTK